MKKYIIAALLALVTASVTVAQPLPDGVWKWHYERGDALYKAGKYVESHEEYSKASLLREEMNQIERRDLDYHLAMSAYKADKAGAVKQLVYYLETYPESASSTQARFALANLLFDREDYGEAIINYEAVNTKRLSKDELDEYNFKTGYSHFARGEYSRIYPYMSQINFKSDYYIHAQYTMGYAEYRDGNYAAAKRYFTTIENAEAYAQVLPFYLMQIEFSEGNYHYVTENANRLLAGASGPRAMEIVRMIAESWFYTSSWENAARTFSEYEARGGVTDRQTHYMTGFSYYMLGRWSEAEKSLSRVPGPDDKLSQNASYHLGDVYLKLNDKSRAMQSFSIASVQGYDNKISEDALFNYGKLQYELGGGYFNEAINVLNRYLVLYPSSQRVPQVKEYLMAAYYNSHNFDAAYQAIMQMPNPDNNVRAALQKISYFRALECFMEGDLEEASRMLEESLNNRYNAKYTALAGYWQGEILYKQGNYNEAVQKYDTYVRLSPRTEPENLMARYNSGYAYFNMEEWEASKMKFEDFLADYKRPDSFRADAFNRMGDIEYSGRNFWRAIERYDDAAKQDTPEKYYSVYQRALMLGMVDRPERKIESLNAIVDSGESPYVPDALYELGRTHLATQNYRAAAATLEEFTQRYPSDPKYISALLDLGLAYQNLKDNRKALEYYKMVVERERHSPQARDAMNGIRGIYVEENDVNTYFAYARDLGIETDLGTVQRDSLAFVSAQRVYLSGDRERASAALDDYIAGYPNGAYVSNALYYSGENAIARGDRQQAYRYFTTLGEMYQNSYTAAGLERQASLGMELGDYGNAAIAYYRLSKSGLTAGKRDEALRGYLAATVAVGNDASTERVTEDIIARASDKGLLREAKFVRAGVLAKADRGEEALTIYRELSSDVSDAQGAESAYRVIEATYSSGDNTATEKLIYDFADKRTTQEFWLAKSFLILGDIYAAAGDTFQARSTYQSIVDGYSNPNDGIVAEAAGRISNLK